MTQRNRYIAKIEGLDGHGKHRSQWMTFSNDLQGALKQYTENVGLDVATQFLRGALIVYPLGPYTDKSVPPMGLGRIVAVQRKKQGFHARPRAQFLMPQRWHGTDDQDIRDALRYVQHDYQYWTRQQIAADLAAWRHKYKLRNAFIHWPRWGMRLVTQWRIWRARRYLDWRAAQRR
ncbi:hypothetical protein J5F27_07965 [Schleiferilactobacillus harbinensis]|uniref:DUF7679 family protein n=1 Tax=Schleiferilactobacillus harbinensis TaxID=304207 RepID=UPI001AAF9BC1|nr:hypothetical protein [Schleiferilactobacillus harbinensis]MBO3091857.1 hypothetical protein [Schleiferilactobacillus harbinensis]